MNKFKLVALTLVVCSSAVAKSRFDFNFETLGRSYPLVAAARGTLGYGLVFWGDDNKKPWYGFLRPSITGTAIGKFSSVKGQIEFFPVSILGVRAGKEAADLSDKHPDFDCVTYKCSQKFTKSFYAVNLTLGGGGFFLNVDQMREKWTPEVHDRAFITPVHALALNREGEDIDTRRVILGTSLSDKWTTFVLNMYSETRDTNKRAKLTVLSFIYKPVSSVAITMGGGTFSSDLKETDFTAVFGVKWNISPSVGLF